MGTEQWDLNELAEAAGVTPRTVRYYVQQGLLPSPAARGPGAHYERNHLDRLRLIKRLQRQHYPLAEIRRRLEALDDDGVRTALQDTPEATHGSALDYARDVLAGGSYRVTREALPSMAFYQSPAPEPPKIKTGTKSTWERVSLSPDVELHIRRPLSREQNKIVERLLEAARRLFEEE
jgi:DNA-binding transcriptional MerR regulator